MASEFGTPAGRREIMMEVLLCLTVVNIMLIKISNNNDDDNIYLSLKGLNNLK